MRKLACTLFTAALFWLSPVHARTYELPSYPLGYNDPARLLCGSTIVARAEALYFRAFGSDFTYAFSDWRALDDPKAANVPIGTAELATIEPDFAMRLGLGLISPSGCHSFSFRYTNLRMSHRNAVINPTDTTGLQGAFFRIIWPAFGDPAVLPIRLFGTNSGARARVRFSYDAYDVQWGRRRLLGCDFYYDTFVGIHVAKVYHRFEVDYLGGQQSGIIGRCDERGWMWGVGPMMGIDFHYELISSWGIDGRLAAGCLGGEKRLDYVQWVGNDLALSNKICRSHIVVPMWNARVGVSYTAYCGGGVTFALAAGYEYVTYLNSLPRAFFNGQGATFNMQCFNTNFDGIYVSAKLFF